MFPFILWSSRIFRLLSDWQYFHCISYIFIRYFFVLIHRTIFRFVQHLCIFFLFNWYYIFTFRFFIPIKSLNFLLHRLGLIFMVSYTVLYGLCSIANSCECWFSISNKPIVSVYISITSIRFDWNVHMVNPSMGHYLPCLSATLHNRKPHRAHCCFYWFNPIGANDAVGVWVSNPTDGSVATYIC